MEDILIIQLFSSISLVLSIFTFLYVLVRWHLFINSDLFESIEAGVRIKNSDDNEIKTKLTVLKDRLVKYSTNVGSFGTKLKKLQARMDSHLKSGKK